ncbi:sulfurtransferase [Xylanimonas ulmi]|uniref:Thiosulfate/3-mercaptopyruvate sulfurtransferase n=1 Tax=Xylanimonas ulmi TaxID=228973 RepID=A0A4Q7M4K1_9MICO|nr:rhodanese-like domain-containing protein [Xylanibacterium ulmi]RZS61943.1 thiosulfate/3-mercaptopyruvate sulfurtransferase [Xylanibacterium ulmi]
MSIAPSRPTISPGELAEALSHGQHAVVLAVSRRRPGWAASVPPRRRIPGAYVVDFDKLVGPSHPGGGENPLPTEAQLARLVRRWGVHDDTPVVVYSTDEVSTATRVWWVLRWAGLADVRVLDGGLSAWQEAGGSLSDDEPAAGAGTASLRLGSLPTVDAEGAAQLARSGRLLDARGRAYLAGHIPGAISLPATAALHDGRIRGEAELRSLFGTFVGGDPVGAYCGSGVAGTVLVHVLHTLAVNAALYPGSWSAWSAEARPVATRLA